MFQTAGYPIIPMSSPGVSTSLCEACRVLYEVPQLHHPPLNIEVLRSNHLPSRVEFSQVPSFVERSVQDLERVEERIIWLRYGLERLEKHRATLRQDIERRKSWISPIRKLPVEILQEIFSRACLGDRPEQFSLDISSAVVEDHSHCEYNCRTTFGCSDGRFITRKRTNAIPSRLSHVCSHWMNVIVGLPRLWSSIRLNLAKLDRKHARLVHIYLGHSKEHPLKIHLHEHLEDSYMLHEDTTQIIERAGYSVLGSIMRELSRCEELSYDLDTDGPIQLVHEEFRPQSLHRLSFFGEKVWDDVGPKTQWFWSLVRDSPSLTHMVVEVLKPDYIPSNLQILKINYKEESDCGVLLEALFHLSNLRSLYLHSFSPAPDSISQMSLHSTHTIGLRDLTVVNSDTLSSLDVLFSVLTLPALSSLKIFTSQRISRTSGDHDTYQDVATISYRDDRLASLHAFLARSSCPLRELVLHAEPYSSDAVLSLLENQPGLVGLSLKIRVPPYWPESASILMNVDLVALVSATITTS
ncbi:hypothetical protein VNI00_002128 [Paramarasmius palmivorus]|uniref:F-box domain-containing protein n=1 Tax=Paramarasmius palmivorus TaxID=297713 RepID=A0AAW0E3L4_9AGAR